ncbi:MAG: hypothetical protein ACI9X0_001997, partial [Kiritimatiellia bacterium]
MADAIEFDPLLQTLREHDVVTADVLQEIWDEHEESERPIRDIILSRQILSEDELLELIAGYHASRVINLPATDIPPDVIHSVPASVARMYNCLPVSST